MRISNLKFEISKRAAFFLLVLALSACTCTHSTGMPAAIPLWQGVAPGSEGQTAPEQVSIQTVPAAPGRPAFSFHIVSSVNEPSITPFLPYQDDATGVAVIIAPGGGHQFLAIDHEGYNVGRWLAAHGIAGFVLKYRLAKEKGSPYKVDVHELMDIQRAIRLVRSRAGEWHVDPQKVGVMGFSAGGELALLASTRFDHPVQGTHDAIDALNCRPDFMALLYPGGLNDPSAVKVTKETPPAFLACSYTDRLTISENLAKFYLMLKEAGVPAELHIYASGGHGFGIRPTTMPVGTWPDRFLDWLRDRGWIEPQINADERR
jgi:acetyl esterase/lipase